MSTFRTAGTLQRAEAPTTRQQRLWSLRTSGVIHKRGTFEITADGAQEHRERWRSATSVDVAAELTLTESVGRELARLGLHEHLKLARPAPAMT